MSTKKERVQDSLAAICQASPPTGLLVPDDGGGWHGVTGGGRIVVRHEDHSAFLNRAAVEELVDEGYLEPGSWADPMVEDVIEYAKSTGHQVRRLKGRPPHRLSAKGMTWLSKQRKVA